jgi:hypothetical protein
MYYVTVILLMLVCPALGVVLEAAALHSTAHIGFLIAKWFVFWMVGVRLFAAGVRQALQPQFSAGEIFGARTAESWPIVREVGFGNIAIGTLGIGSLFLSAWILPAAVVGGLCYGLAGLLHASRKGKNAMEQTAMVSDAFAFLVLLFAAMKIPI